MGKYDAVLAGLTPIAQEEDPRRQDVLNRIKLETYGMLKAEGLAQEYVKLRAEKARIAAELSRVQTNLDAVTQLLMDSQDRGDHLWGMFGAKKNAIRLPNGDVIRIDQEPSSKVVDAEAFRLWCLQNGYERQMALHPGRRESIVAERLLAGEADPDGLEVGSWKKIVYTPHKEK